MKNSKSVKKNSGVKPAVQVPSDYPWKVLAQVSNDLSHLFTEEERNVLYGIARNRDLEAYMQLSKNWSPQCTSSEVGISNAVFRAKYQVAALLKKFQFPSSDDDCRAMAISKFKAAEDRCRSYNHQGVRELANIQDERLLNAFSYARNFLERLLDFEPPSNKVLTHWSRHGPGANLDTKHGLVSKYFKYADWPYSCTQGAFGLAKAAIEDDERWLGALEDSYRERFSVPRHVILNREAFWSSVINIVPGNRIAFVPKTYDTHRSIAIEPSLNLYLQLGIDGYIRRRLKRYGIDIDSQEKNKELARRGSLNWETSTSFVTLDLESASDSISKGVCYQLLPLLWYDRLMALRSPVGDLNGETIAYAKISSMGNGYTFALETAIFAALVFGVYKEYRGSYDSETCAVFGDDIVVPKDLADPLVRLLNLCGFSVNPEKSFVEGPFRESCGADWFKGVAVRPVFLKKTPSTVMDLFSDINRIRRFLSLRFMEEESKTCSLLEKWIPNYFRDYTGPYSDTEFDSYLHCTQPSFRWADQCWKFKRLVLKPTPLRGNQFLFRKLMHELRETPVAEPSFQGGASTAIANAFTVTRRNSETVRTKYSAAVYWQSTYADQLPGWEPRN